jgi:hypothetical protein
MAIWEGSVINLFMHYFAMECSFETICLHSRVFMSLFQILDAIIPIKYKTVFITILRLIKAPTDQVNIYHRLFSIGLNEKAIYRKRWGCDDER